MKISDFLGRHVSVLLRTEPFNHWPVERSTEDDLEEPIIQYVFTGHALDLRCDRDDKIRTIFLSADRHNTQDDILFEISFVLTREQVRSRLGKPTKSGGRIVDPILGENGEWDRFSFPDYAIHVEYRMDRDEIRQITLMRNDAVPG